MALASPPGTPPDFSRLTTTRSNVPPETTFDIVAHYNNLTSTDASLSPAIAAIESLIALLTHTPLTTVSETLALLSHQGQILLRAQLNPIPLSAGTDLFQRYLISSFQQRSSANSTDFSVLRSKLVTESKLFVSRAKNASNSVAASFLPFITDDCIVFTFPSPTPLLNTIINNSITQSHYFTHINLILGSPHTSAGPSSSTASIPTSHVSAHSLPLALSSLPTTSLQSTILLITATAVFSNGTLLASPGTTLLCTYAATQGIKVYCAVESFKFVRAYPLSTSNSELARLGVKQDILHLNGGVNGNREDAGHITKEDGNSSLIPNPAETVEIVPSHLVTALVTENGIMTPGSVSEELIKLWF